ncbi:hypothetical protein [Croceicoccus sp. BE223]|uniref:hypothetical protein n=1 Tax=Croceicoccus sp. BE223 TaxID=2817716 RepID=UPI00285FC9C8|nr:hypothetical protein [Croceicoccus sp. BE223]MDR7101392.1 hypothetical protein [Croceicoccus sp. BE223]
MKKSILPIASLAIMSACNPAPQETNNGTEMPDAPQQPVTPPPVADSQSPEIVEVTPLAIDLTRNEWATAANKDECAPLVLTTDGGAGGEARRANFSGGWGVAFDTDGVKSAYGVAGPGIVESDRADGQEARLKGQWPYFIRLERLAQPAFAGYGLEGAKPYGAERPDGVGDNSLAYVHVAGQGCTYNVWSRLGRAHLEVLLDSLRLLPKD